MDCILCSYSNTHASFDVTKNENLPQVAVMCYEDPLLPCRLRASSDQRGQTVLPKTRPVFQNFVLCIWLGLMGVCLF